MGPQLPLWNSTFGSSVLAGSGSQDRACRRAGSQGRIFPGVSHDQFVVGQKPVGKVASLRGGVIAWRCVGPVTD